VLRALGRDPQLAQSSLRFSLGRDTSAADVDFVVHAVQQQLARLRALSPYAHAAGGDPWDEGPQRAGAATISGAAGGPGEETWVRFQLRVAGDTVKDARYQVFGCPHTMATAAWLCGELRGRVRSDLIPGTPAAWARDRDIPVEKLGRLLRLEDALRECLAHWA